MTYDMLHSFFCLFLRGEVGEGELWGLEKKKAAKLFIFIFIIIVALSFTNFNIDRKNFVDCP